MGTNDRNTTDPVITAPQQVETDPVQPKSQELSATLPRPELSPVPASFDFLEQLENDLLFSSILGSVAALFPALSKVPHALKLEHDARRVLEIVEQSNIEGRLRTTSVLDDEERWKDIVSIMLAPADQKKEVISARIQRVLNKPNLSVDPSGKEFQQLLKMLTPFLGGNDVSGKELEKISRILLKESGISRLYEKAEDRDRLEEELTSVIKIALAVQNVELLNQEKPKVSTAPVLRAADIEELTGTSFLTLRAVETEYLLEYDLSSAHHYVIKRLEDICERKQLPFDNHDISVFVYLVTEEIESERRLKTSGGTPPDKSEFKKIVDNALKKCGVLEDRNGEPVEKAAELEAILRQVSFELREVVVFSEQSMPLALPVNYTLDDPLLNTLLGEAIFNFGLDRNREKISQNEKLLLASTFEKHLADFKKVKPEELSADDKKLVADFVDEVCLLLEERKEAPEHLAYEKFKTITDLTNSRSREFLNQLQTTAEKLTRCNLSYDGFKPGSEEESQIRLNSHRRIMDLLVEARALGQKEGTTTELENSLFYVKNEYFIVSETVTISRDGKNVEIPLKELLQSEFDYGKKNPDVKALTTEVIRKEYEDFLLKVDELVKIRYEIRLKEARKENTDELKKQDAVILAEINAAKDRLTEKYGSGVADYLYRSGASEYKWRLNTIDTLNADLYSALEQQTSYIYREAIILRESKDPESIKMADSLLDTHFKINEDEIKFLEKYYPEIRKELKALEQSVALEREKELEQARVEREARLQQQRKVITTRAREWAEDRGQLVYLVDLAEKRLSLLVSSGSLEGEIEKAKENLDRIKTALSELDSAYEKVFSDKSNDDLFKRFPELIDPAHKDTVLFVREPGDLNLKTILGQTYLRGFNAAEELIAAAAALDNLRPATATGNAWPHELLEYIAAASPTPLLMEALERDYKEATGRTLEEMLQLRIPPHYQKGDLPKIYEQRLSLLKEGKVEAYHAAVIKALVADKNIMAEENAFQFIRMISEFSDEKKQAICKELNLPDGTDFSSWLVHYSRGNSYYSTNERDIKTADYLQAWNSLKQEGKEAELDALMLTLLIRTGREPDVGLTILLGNGKLSEQAERLKSIAAVREISLPGERKLSLNLEEDAASLLSEEHAPLFTALLKGDIKKAETLLIEKHQQKGLEQYRVAFDDVMSAARDWAQRRGEYAALEEILKKEQLELGKTAGNEDKLADIAYRLEKLAVAVKQNDQQYGLFLQNPKYSELFEKTPYLKDPSDPRSIVSIVSSAEERDKTMVGANYNAAYNRALAMPSVVAEIDGLLDTYSYEYVLKKLAAHNLSPEGMELFNREFAKTKRSEGATFSEYMAKRIIGKEAYATFKGPLAQIVDTYQAELEKNGPGERNGHYYSQYNAHYLAQLNALENDDQALFVALELKKELTSQFPSNNRLQLFIDNLKGRSPDFIQRVNQELRKSGLNLDQSLNGTRDGIYITTWVEATLAGRQAEIDGIELLAAFRVNDNNVQKRGEKIVNHLLSLGLNEKGMTRAREAAAVCQRICGEDPLKYIEKNVENYERWVRDGAANNNRSSYGDMLHKNEARTIQAILKGDLQTAQHELVRRTFYLEYTLKPDRPWNVVDLNNLNIVRAMIPKDRMDEILKKLDGEVHTIYKDKVPEIKGIRSYVQVMGNYRYEIEPVRNKSATAAATERNFRGDLNLKAMDLIITDGPLDPSRVELFNMLRQELDRTFGQSLGFRKEIKDDMNIADRKFRTAQKHAHDALDSAKEKLDLSWYDYNPWSPKGMSLLLGGEEGDFVAARAANKRADIALDELKALMKLLVQWEGDRGELFKHYEQALLLTMKGDSPGARKELDTVVDIMERQWRTMSKQVLDQNQQIANQKAMRTFEDVRKWHQEFDAKCAKWESRIETVSTTALCVVASVSGAGVVIAVVAYPVMRYGQAELRVAYGLETRDEAFEKATQQLKKDSVDVAVSATIGKVLRLRAGPAAPAGLTRQVLTKEVLEDGVQKLGTTMVVKYTTTRSIATTAKMADLGRGTVGATPVTTLKLFLPFEEEAPAEGKKEQQIVVKPFNRTQMDESLTKLKRALPEKKDQIASTPSEKSDTPVPKSKTSAESHIVDLTSPRSPEKMEIAGAELPKEVITIADLEVDDKIVPTVDEIAIPEIKTESGPSVAFSNPDIPVTGIELTLDSPNEPGKTLPSGIKESPSVRVDKKEETFTQSVDFVAKDVDPDVSGIDFNDETVVTTTEQPVKKEGAPSVSVASVALKQDTPAVNDDDDGTGSGAYAKSSPDRDSGEDDGGDDGGSVTGFDLPGDDPEPVIVTRLAETRKTPVADLKEDETFTRTVALKGQESLEDVEGLDFDNKDKIEVANLDKDKDKEAEVTVTPSNDKTVALNTEGEKNADGQVTGIELQEKTPLVAAHGPEAETDPLPAAKLDKNEEALTKTVALKSGKPTEEIIGLDIDNQNKTEVANLDKDGDKEPEVTVTPANDKTVTLNTEGEKNADDRVTGIELQEKTPLVSAHGEESKTDPLPAAKLDKNEEALTKTVALKSGKLTEEIIGLDIDNQNKTEVANLDKDGDKEPEVTLTPANDKTVALNTEGRKNSDDQVTGIELQERAPLVAARGPEAETDPLPVVKLDNNDEKLTKTVTLSSKISGEDIVGLDDLVDPDLVAVKPDLKTDKTPAAKINPEDVDKSSAVTSASKDQQKDDMPGLDLDQEEQLRLAADYGAKQKRETTPSSAITGDREPATRTVALNSDKSNDNVAGIDPLVDKPAVAADIDITDNKEPLAKINPEDIDKSAAVAGAKDQQKDDLHGLDLDQEEQLRLATADHAAKQKIQTTPSSEITGEREPDTRTVALNSDKSSDKVTGIDPLVDKQTLAADLNIKDNKEPTTKINPEDVDKSAAVAGANDRQKDDLPGLDLDQEEQLRLVTADHAAKQKRETTPSSEVTGEREPATRTVALNSDKQNDKVAGIDPSVEKPALAGDIDVTDNKVPSAKINPEDVDKSAAVVIAPEDRQKDDLPGIDLDKEEQLRLATADHAAKQKRLTTPSSEVTGNLQPDTTSVALKSENQREEVTGLRPEDLRLMRDSDVNLKTGKASVSSINSKEEIQSDFVSHKTNVPTEDKITESDPEREERLRLAVADKLARQEHAKLSARQLENTVAAVARKDKSAKKESYETGELKSQNSFNGDQQQPASSEGMAKKPDSLGDFSQATAVVAAKKKETSDREIEQSTMSEKLLKREAEALRQVLDDFRQRSSAIVSRPAVGPDIIDLPSVGTGVLNNQKEVELQREAESLNDSLALYQRRWFSIDSAGTIGAHSASASATGENDSASEELRLKEEETLRSSIILFLEKRQQYLKVTSNASVPGNTESKSPDSSESISSVNADKPSVRGIIASFTAVKGQSSEDLASQEPDFDRIYAELRTKKSNDTSEVLKTSDTENVDMVADNRTITPELNFSAVTGTDESGMDDEGTTEENADIRIRRIFDSMRGEVLSNSEADSKVGVGSELGTYTSIKEDSIDGNYESFRAGNEQKPLTTETNSDVQFQIESVKVARQLFVACWIEQGLPLSKVAEVLSEIEVSDFSDVPNPATEDDETGLRLVATLSTLSGHSWESTRPATRNTQRMRWLTQKGGKVNSRIRDIQELVMILLFELLQDKAKRDRIDRHLLEQILCHMDPVLLQALKNRGLLDLLVKKDEEEALQLAEHSGEQEGRKISRGELLRRLRARGSEAQGRGSDDSETSDLSRAEILGELQSESLYNDEDVKRKLLRDILEK